MIQVYSDSQPSTPFTLHRHTRTRRIRLAVYCDGSCVVTAPVSVSEQLVEKFVAEKSSWIREARERFAALNHIIFVKKNKKTQREEYLATKARALALATERIAKWNVHYGFTVRNICIKNQKTRWGSCSKKGNLNFNYKIALLPEKLTDYIIVHELCHLGEFNHSRAFWALVEETLPDYRALRSELRRVGVREV